MLRNFHGTLLVKFYIFVVISRVRKYIFTAFVDCKGKIQAPTVCVAIARLRRNIALIGI